MSSGGRWPEGAGKLGGPALIRAHGCAFARFLWPPGGRFLPLGLGCHRRPRWWILARTSRVRAASRHSVRPVGDRAARLGRGARRPRGGPTPRESGAAVTKTVAAVADPHFSLLRCCTVYPPVRHLGRTESAQRRLTRSCVVKSGRPPRQHVAAGGQLLAASMRRQTGTSCWWPCWGPSGGRRPPPPPTQRHSKIPKRDHQGGFAVTAPTCLPFFCRRP